MGILDKKDCCICHRYVMKDEILQDKQDKFADKKLYYCSRKDCKKYRTQYAHLYKSFKEHKEAIGKND